MAIAFRCKHCGRLEEPEHAGERELPLSCRVCGAGSHLELDAAGNVVRVDEPDNWQVLDELPDSELDKLLKHHAIDRKDVVKHKPAKSSGNADAAPQHLVREASDTLGAEDVAS